MARILFLYDTKEADLARDFKDFLAELSVNFIMIPLSPDLGMTLEQKEERYFDLADGAIFLVTPGSERAGVKFPSPSVSHELRQAKQKFSSKPESVICLVDEECKMPAIDQIAYVSFRRQNMRSVISAFTQMLKNFKRAEFFPGLLISIKPANLSPAEIESLFGGLDDLIQDALLALSGAPEGGMHKSEFNKHLSERFSLETRKINFLRWDLLKDGFVTESVNYISLTDLGRKIAKLQSQKMEKMLSPEILTIVSDEKTIFTGSNTNRFLPSDVKAVPTQIHPSWKEADRYSELRGATWIADRKNITNDEAIHGGQYTFVREFEIPFELNHVHSAEIFLVVDDFCELFINGNRLGRVEGFHALHRFDITKIIQKDKNRVQFVVENISAQLDHDPNVNKGFYESKDKFLWNPYGFKFSIVIQYLRQ